MRSTTTLSESEVNTLRDRIYESTLGSDSQAVDVLNRLVRRVEELEELEELGIAWQEARTTYIALPGKGQPGFDEADHREGFRVLGLSLGALLHRLDTLFVADHSRHACPQDDCPECLDQEECEGEA